MQYVKRFRTKQIQGHSLFIISFLVLVSCTSTISPAATITVTVTNGSGDLPAPATSEQVIRSSTAIYTPQPTTMPSMPMLTASPILSPTIVTSTPEPTPTLTNEQKADNLTRLMTENGGCELPCWWGIVPGETNFAMIPEWFIPQGLVGVRELSQLFVVLRNESLVWLEGGRELHARGAGSSIDVEFEVKNDIIQSTRVRGGKENEGFVDDWQQYSLNQVLTRYGVPSQVLVYHPWQAHAGPPYYHLLLFYEEEGIQIDYAGIAQYPIDEKIRACPDLSNVDVINLFLYQPEKIDNVVELVLPPETVDFITSSGTVYNLIGWEQTVGTSLEVFYETFKDGESNNCFEFTMYMYR